MPKPYLSQRRGVRAPVRVPARVVDGTHTVDTEVLQLSEGGLFVALHAPPRGRLHFDVSFELPGQGWRTSRVEVMSVLAPGQFRQVPEASGLGCRFVGLDQATRVAIADTIRRVRQTYSQLQFALALSRPPPTLSVLLRQVGLQHVADRSELKRHVDSALQQLSAA